MARRLDRVAQLVSRRVLPVLAWSRLTIWTGVLSGRQLQFTTVHLYPRLEDIRNCSPAPGAGWAAVSGVGPSASYHGVWRLDLETGSATMLLEAESIGTVALAPGLERFIYTAPPQGGRGDISLYVHDLGDGISRLLRRGGVARDCVPSISITGVVAYHAPGGQIMAFDLATSGSRALFSGEHPAFAPDGRQLAYLRGQDLHVWDQVGNRSKVLARPAGLWNRRFTGSLAWSHDSSLLIARQPAGLFGRQTAFHLVHAVTGKRARLKTSTEGVQGLCFG